MAKREHAKLPILVRDLEDRLIDRRQFVRYAALLGMSAGAAYGLAGRLTGGSVSSPAQAAEMPKGGTLKIAMRIPKLESPHTFATNYDSNVVRQVNGYLTRTGVDNVTRPDLASWTVSDDLRTWTFTMAAVTWHKGGSFTADDAAWNIKRCLDPKVGSSVVGLMKGYMLNDVDTGEKDKDGNAIMTTELWDANAIEVKDDRTLVLNLKQPQIAVPEHLFHYPFLILNPAENGVWGLGSNGTGAFTLAELEVGRKAVVKAVDGRGAHLQTIEFIDLGDDPSPQVSALQSKQVHGLYDGNIQQLSLLEGMPHVKRYDVVSADTAVARMQPVKPFDDPRVRMAVRLATDQEKTLAIAYGNLGTIGEHHHVAPVHPDYKSLPPFKRDVERAKKLLSEAGYPDGIDTAITCKSDPPWELTAVQAMVEQWKEAGVRCKIDNVPSAKFWEVWTEVPFGFTFWVHRPLGVMVLALAYRTGVPWNESKFSNKEIDELLTQAEAVVDAKSRSEILGKIEAILQEDGPIVQPLWRSLFTYYDKRVLGYQQHPTRYIFGEELALAAE